jgi:hypothetical protein
MAMSKKKKNTSVPAPAIKRRVLRFVHLTQLGYVENRERLRNLIEHHGFPPGRWTGHNTRTWDADEVEAWWNNRPIERPTLKEREPETSDREADHNDRRLVDG